MKVEKRLTIPNVLSGYRLISFPFVVLLIAKNYESMAGTMICINLVTDILDGWIARKFKLETALGARLDSLADIGTNILALWCLYKFKNSEVGRDIIALWVFVVFYFGTHIVSFLKFGKFPSLHLYSVKITGYLQGSYFFCLFTIGHISWFFWLAMVWGYLAWTEEAVVLIYLREMKSNARGLWFLLRESRNKKSKVE